ncbi:hypothetical protein ASPBRDRAFT_28753 [Aspergillus brasiliensis CBS 101740]|uniref:Cytochrome P450 n=1 Tax=Aspergillus brasiliensis (strain CBS 101740 / IMI 381727 / IBT 21946) TaxID=767769 RepID=A0A1L9UPP4_ASPBC|nr:hypothetical protein ASPBRDRAFT_28753 [Aspergillus brasiliensis CBS 101740]
MHKVLKEVPQAFTADDQITVQSTHGLMYLEAVFNETMRLHHLTPITLPRVIPPEGRQLDGHFIPGTTIVGINLHNIHTSLEHWDEPHAIRPERFLPKDNARCDSRFNKDVKAAHMPLSTGPSICIASRQRIGWRRGQPISCTSQSRFKPGPLIERNNRMNGSFLMVQGAYDALELRYWK